MFNYSVKSKSSDSRARTGVIETAHGRIETPIFMPVGTLATVKSLTPEELHQCGARIILGNTYHLTLRPGCDIIGQFGGLHDFMQWPGPILTDSGGFQIFSLAALNKVTDEGAVFRSHIDGAPHTLTPEKAIDIQSVLNSDIMMCLDQCIPYPAEEDEARRAVERTTLWARRSKSVWGGHDRTGQALFGIVQGGMYRALRRASTEQIVEIGFSGYALGGLSVGEPKPLMLEMADACLPLLPENRPKYIMGVGTPEDIVNLVGLGADMFDCVLPTRNARNGQYFTRFGAMNISNSRYKTDSRPIDDECGCYTCRRFSRAYLRHLYMSRELLSYRLGTIHNLFYYLQLATRIREAIDANRYEAFKTEFNRDGRPDN